MGSRSCSWVVRRSAPSWVPTFLWPSPPSPTAGRATIPRRTAPHLKTPQSPVVTNPPPLKNIGRRLTMAPVRSMPPSG